VPTVRGETLPFVWRNNISKGVREYWGRQRLAGNTSRNTRPKVNTVEKVELRRVFVSKPCRDCGNILTQIRWNSACDILTCHTLRCGLYGVPQGTVKL